MNREVEERIVAMHFDNEDFEKNAKSTIDTLDQLKKGLNLEDAARGFSVFEKLGKTLNFEKANQSLTKVRNGLNSMNGALGKVFKIGEAPLKEAEGMVNTIRGYLNKVIGFDFASKIVGGIENIFRSLTIAPVSAGWDQYQSKMDSVKTIMSSTGESIEVVEKHLEGLTNYANKTIYSLTDMTSNLGKFTNNGVKLEDAVMAMEGIANAAADAGQGAQQASMAMYNFSQAMGVGKMTSIDWKSIENANMATGRLKDTFLQVAAAGGRITKEVKKIGNETQETFWLTTDENGKALKQKIELTRDNFREYLSKGWLDKETMMRALQIYSGAGIDQNILNAWGITDPEKQKALLKIGEDALEAATQVRTFSKMLDALRESVQSGWANSFEIIFGNMEEGTKLWTKLNDRMDKILSTSSDRRNSILKAWAETTEGDKAYWTRDELGNKIRTGVKGGRDILIDSFFELMNVVEQFSSMVTEAFTSVFGKIDSKKLFNLTIQFRDFVAKIKNWLGTTKDANSRIAKLQQGLKGIFGIIRAGLKVAKSLFDLAKRLAMPIIDFLIDKFGEFGKQFQILGKMNIPEMFKYIWGSIKKAWEGIKDLFTRKEGMTEIPLFTIVKNAWEKFKDILHGWFDDIGLGETWDAVAEWWNNLKTSFTEGWNAVKEWWDKTGIGQFFERMWNEIVRWFTPESTTDANGNVTTGNAPIVQFFVGIKEKIDGAFLEIQKWWNKSGIPVFFKNMWDEIVNLFRPKLVSGYRNGNLESWYEDSPIVSFFKNIGSKIDSAFQTVKTWWEGSGISDFFKNMWDEIVKLFTPTTITDDNGTVTTGYAPIVQFFLDLADKVGAAFQTVKTWWEGSGIPDFFATMWDEIVNLFRPKLVSGYRNGNLESWYEDSPIVTFFNSIWTGVQNIYNKIAEWWNSEDVQGVLTSVGDFFSNLWGWLMNLINGTGDSEADSSKKTKGVKPGHTALAKIRDGAKAAVKDASGTTKSLNLFERILNAVGGFFDKVKELYEKVSNSKELNKFLTAFGEFFKGLVHIITEIMSRLGKLMQGDTSFDNLLVIIIPGLILVTEQLLTFFNNKHLAGINGVQNFAQKFLEVAGGLFLMAIAISVLTTIDQNKMWAAVGAITVLGVVIAVIIGVLSKLKRNSVADAPVTSGERILNNLISTIGKVGILAVALAMLPKIIETIGNVKKEIGDVDIGTDLLNVMLGLSALITGISIAFTTVQLLTGKMGLDPFATLKTTISILEVLGVILVAFFAGGGLMGLFKKYVGDEAIDVVVDGINSIGRVFSAIGGVFGGFLGSLFGGGSPEQKAMASADATRKTLESMSEMAKVFDMEKISGITRIITMVQSLSNGSEMIDSSKLENFAIAMQRVGAGIYEIAKYILEMEGPLSEINDPNSEMTQKLRGFVDITAQIINALAPLGQEFHVGQLMQRVEELAKEDNLKKLVENLNTIMSGLGGVDQPDSGIQFDGLTIVKKLFTAIQEGLIDPNLPKFDATPVVDAIIEALMLGDTAIAQIVHDMVQQGLNLNKNPNGTNSGYTIDENTAGLATKLLSGESVDLTSVTNGFHEQLYGKDGKGGLLGELNGMSDQIPSMTSMFEGKGWLDFKDENGQEIDLLGPIQEHVGELGTTLSEMEPLKVTITPVVDFSQLTPENVQQELDKYKTPLGIGTDTLQMQIDFTGLDSALNLASIRTALDDIRSAIVTWGGDTADAVSGLAYHMDGIANEVGSLKLWLDTGALVGGITPMIDRELYRRQMAASVTGVSPAYS